MDYGYEIQKLQIEVDSLRKALLQSQRNNSQIVSKTDDTSNKVKQITPTTYTKTAYIGDTEVEFEPSKDGNVSVFFDKSVGNYRVVKNYYARRMMVIFDNPLEEVTEVTLSIV